MDTAEWDGVTLRSDYHDIHVADRDRLADAARDAEWTEVLRRLREMPWVNRSRVGGKSAFAPLHQAAWHGADPGVVRALVELGAWRTLRASNGQRALDIATDRGHDHLLDLLRPAPEHPVDDTVRSGLEDQLHLLIRGRVPRLVTEHRLRLPQLEPLTELTSSKLWFPVPGMYGGFAITLHDNELTVDSWCRVAGGSAQTHRITADSIHLVNSGWDI